MGQHTVYEIERDKPFMIEFGEYVGFASTWDELQSTLRVCGDTVQQIIVCASGEILYDVRDGWDIVTDGPSRE